MLLKEISLGENIIIQALCNKQQVEFESKILFINEKAVILSPVLQEERLIGFSSENVKTNIIYKDAKFEYIFKNVKILSNKNKNQYYYIVSSELFGEKINRRKTPRYEINKSCILTPGEHRKTEDAYIKDISINGIGIISDKDINIKKEDIIKISFEPNVREKNRIDIKAKIVRIEKNETTGKILYGCEILNESANWNKYVMEIQRSRIKLQNHKPI